MRGRQIGVSAALVFLLTACAGKPEPVTIYKHKPVYIETTLACSHEEIPSVEGPDNPPQDSDIYDAAVYSKARIYALRNYATKLLNELAACDLKEKGK